MNYIKSILNLQTYSKKSKRILNKYGNEEIKSMEIIRHPLNDALVYIGNHMDTLESYDNLYHIYLIITLENKVILVEKDEIINISLKIKHYRDEEYLLIKDIPDELTLNNLMLNTIDLMGRYQFFSYEIEFNNCQNFIKCILQANNLLNVEREKFIMQDLQSIFINHKHFKEILNTIINVAELYDRLSGCQISNV
jgi:hypothetical protein